MGARGKAEKIAAEDQHRPAQDQLKTSETSKTSETPTRPGVTKPKLTSVGKNKHVVIVKLQKMLERNTNRLISIDTLWEMLGEMYDLEALDEMVSCGL